MDKFGYTASYDNDASNFTMQMKPNDGTTSKDKADLLSALSALQSICQPDSKYKTQTLDVCDRYFKLLELQSLQEDDAYDTDFTGLFPEMSNAYGNRFVVYTVITFLAVVFNILSVTVLLKIRAHWSSHHLLLLNLAVCDIIGAVLLWMYHNSPVIFPLFKITTLGHCLFISMVLVASFILTLCNSSCNLLLLAVNLYLAICHPLFSATKVTKCLIRIVITLTWCGSIALGTIPVIVMLYRNHSENCTSFAVDMGQKSLELCAYALVAFIVLTIILYGRIYFVIWRYRRYATTIRNNTNSRENKYKAFLTTLVLAGALFCSWLPYMIFNFITVHLDVKTIPDSVLNVKFYFVDFLPVFHFLTDPAIYGLRMMEIRRGYQKLCCKKNRSSTGQQASIMTKRCTLRYSTHKAGTTTAV